MVGSGLKKLAKEHNMKVGSGIAYGSLGGYIATLSEGAGFKLVVFATRFPNAVRKTEFLDRVNRTDLQKQYRVLRLEVSEKNICVVFHDNPGTMKKIRDFFAYFLPLLEEYGASRDDICVECGGTMTEGQWIMIEGAAYCLHGSCAEKVKYQIEEENTQRKEEAAGSYLSGLIGALLGSAVGAVVWAIVLNLGYVASLVGLLIGWLAEKGYGLLKGKQGKLKVAILILAILVGVLLGTLGGDVLTLVQMMAGGELPGLTTADIPWMLRTMWEESPEYRSGMITNIGTGVLFAALGVYAILRRAGKEVADTKVVYLR